MDENGDLPKFGIDASDLRFKGMDMLLFRRLSATARFKVSKARGAKTFQLDSAPNDVEVNSAGRMSPVMKVLERSNTSGATRKTAMSDNRK